MNGAVVGLLFGLGASTWVFTKLQDRTGYGNNKSALTGAAVVFVITFFVIFSLASILTPN